MHLAARSTEAMQALRALALRHQVNVIAHTVDLLPSQTICIVGAEILGIGVHLG